MFDIKVQRRLTEFKEDTIVSDEGNHIGLPNKGNTCYLNAVIQILYRCKLFRYEILLITDIMTKYIENKKLKPNIQRAAETIQSLNILFQSLKVNSLNGLSYFMTKFSKLKPKFSINHQQDAHEFLSYILEALDDCKEFLKQSKEPLIFESTFNGSVTKNIICQNCNKCVESREKFNILTIPVDVNHDTKSSKYGAWSLARWSNLEMLDGDNKYQCENCNSKQNAFMFPWIEIKPCILILHICSFNVFNENSLSSVFSLNMAEKVKGTFPVPLFLPLMHHYFHGKYRNENYYKNILEIYESPQKIKEQYNMKEYVNKSYVGYYLYGMIIHIGRSLSSGHYVTATPSQSNYLKWNIYDDQNVKKINIFEIFENKMYSPYLIFYEKIT
uniref:Ubiquitin carboxyl-terminal hydrolase n=1 Tax=Strongyloides venezuelensis TaxID=75913 RepID=A0A0K0FGD9_STRVS